MVNKTTTTTNTSNMVTMIRNTKFATRFNNQPPHQYWKFFFKYANSKNLDFEEEDYLDDLEKNQTDTMEDEEDNADKNDL